LGLALSGIDQEAMMLAEQIEQEALKLKPVERVRLAECLLGSLDQPDPKTEKLWVEESEARYRAYKNGDVEGVPLDSFTPRLSK
jgi:putative addiction module component (TIGR02574 family)